MQTDTIHKAFGRFRQFGGGRLLWEYAKMGLLPVVLKQGLLLLMGKTDADMAYEAIGRKVNPILINRYASLLSEQKAYYDHQELEHQRRPVVWFCWLQGMDSAPDLVKACYNSIKRYVPDKELVVVTQENVSEYINLPQHIVERYEKGQMPPALFADIIRLELLTRYGGTWMDATVLCTGSPSPDSLMDSDLFLYQSLRKGDRTFYGASNWFMTACANNKVLLVLKDVLTQYWRDYSCTLQYYIFHLFLIQVAQLYPEEMAAMPRRNRKRALVLGDKLTEPYDEQTMYEIEQISCFHKLNYRVAGRMKDASGTFYEEIVKRYGTMVL